MVEISCSDEFNIIIILITTTFLLDAAEVRAARHQGVHSGIEPKTSN